MRGKKIFNPRSPLCSVNGCTNLDSRHGGMCWAHLKRRERCQPLSHPLQPDPTKKYNWVKEKKK